MKKVWRHEKITNSWSRGLIIRLAKKVNLRGCKNRWGVTLLSIVKKKVLRGIINCRLTKEQAGYRKSSGTTQQVSLLEYVQFNFISQYLLLLVLYSTIGLSVYRAFS